MIFRKTLLAAIALLSVFFLANCAEDPYSKDSSVNDSSSSLDTSSGSQPSSSSDPQPSSASNGTPPTPMSMNKYVAEQSPYIGNDKIKYSYSYEGYDFYYIHLGKLKNIPLFSYDPQFHNGVNFVYEIKITETTETSTVETITNSSQTTITVANEYTTSTTNGLKLTQEINAKIPVKIVDVGVKAAAEESWSWYTSNTESFQQTQTTSLTNTITTGTTHTITSMESKTWNFTRDDKIGYYRFTLFSDSDVYLYVIRNSTTGEIDYEFKEYVIQSSLKKLWVLDYSEDGDFGKSDYTGFEFDISLLENLPEPTLLLTPKEKKIIELEYAETGNYTYTFNEGFPAIIEVYAIGGGGGGQGGHFSDLMGGGYGGVGGAGGGGAAAYMKISAKESVDIGVVIGSGGTEGTGQSVNWTSTWQSGYKGEDGKNTTVSVISADKNATIIANGGKGGGGNGGAQDLTGGAGGTESIKPASVTEANFTTAPGANGSNGVQGHGNTQGDIQSKGGNSGALAIGSRGSFGGSGGAIRNSGNRPPKGSAGGGGASDISTKSDIRSGSKGGDGHVIIIITYEE